MLDMNMKRLVVLLLTIGLASGVFAGNDQKKGHGAGGVRADHASETGMEKGKAWAGTREKEDKEPKSEKDKKDKKDKKQKRDKSKGKSKEKKKDKGNR
jgi:hypothetical protein